MMEDYRTNWVDLENVEKAINIAHRAMTEHREINLLEWAQAFNSLRAAIQSTVADNAVKLAEEVYGADEDDNDETEAERPGE